MFRNYSAASVHQGIRLRVLPGIRLYDFTWFLYEETGIADRRRRAPTGPLPRRFRGIHHAQTYYRKRFPYTLYQRFLASSGWVHDQR